MDCWHKTSWVLSVAVLGLLAGGCKTTSIPDGTVVSVVYSSDVRGKLEGCGCKQTGGGIARRSTVLAKARAEDPTVLYCDAGNFMTGTPQADSTRGEVSIAAYNQLQTSVANISERELAAGIEAFKTAAKNAKFEFVSANLRYKGDALAAPYVIKKVKEARVGFVGLCGTRDVMRTDSARLPAGTTILDPLATAREAVVSLKDKADLIIVLSTCGDAMDSLIAHQVPGINLLIGGRSFRSNEMQPWLIDSTRVVRAHRDGRTLGRMDMVFGAEGNIKTFHPTEVGIEAVAPQDDAMLAVVRKFIPNFVDNPAGENTTASTASNPTNLGTSTKR
jgi:5'-nucleotidase / UDP-sugar diphosphatase